MNKKCREECRELLGLVAQEYADADQRTLTERERRVVEILKGCGYLHAHKSARGFIVKATALAFAG
jgi:hypothetical protein